MSNGIARAVIFDMDGVIVDSEPRHERAFREIFQQMGYGETHGIDFHAYLGRSDRALWVDFIAKHRPSQPLEELLAWKQSHFLQMIERERPIFPEVPSLVEKLGRTYRLAVASGSLHPVISAVLAINDLRRHFPVVVSVQDVKRGKPDPDVFLRAAELMETEPAHCTVIEDAAAGVEAGRAAGMRVIAITNSLPGEKLRRAHHVVSSYAEIDYLLSEP